MTYGASRWRPQWGAMGLTFTSEFFRDERRDGGRCIGEAEGALHGRADGIDLGGCCGTEEAERLAGFDVFAHLKEAVKAGGVVDGGIDGGASGAQGEGGASEGFRVHVRHESFPWGGHFGANGGLGEAFIQASLLRGAHGAEGGHGRAIVQRGAGGGLGGFFRREAAGGGGHLCGESDGEGADVLGAFAGEHVERFANFKRVADGAPKGAVHIREQCAAGSPEATAGGQKALGEAAGVGLGFHERAAAKLDVEDEGLRAFGKFLAHDGRGDEGNAGDGACDVAQGIEAAIRGGQRVGLPDHATADVGHNAAELGNAEAHIEAGDAFEFVEGTAGDTEAATRNHGHGEPQGGAKRRQRQGNLVADAAGGVLVRRWARQVEGEAVAGTHHGVGQDRRFGLGHAPEVNGHKPSGDLVVGQGAIGNALHPCTKIGLRMFPAIPLFLDEPLWHHCRVLLTCPF